MVRRLAGEKGSEVQERQIEESTPKTRVLKLWQMIDDEQIGQSWTVALLWDGVLQRTFDCWGTVLGTTALNLRDRKRTTIWRFEGGLTPTESEYVRGMRSTKSNQEYKIRLDRSASGIVRMGPPEKNFTIVVYVPLATICRLFHSFPFFALQWLKFWVKHSESGPFLQINQDHQTNIKLTRGADQNFHLPCMSLIKQQ